MSTTMPSPTPPLTLIVAATRSMGIGHAGTLPWPTLKSELAYFARITKNLPARATSSAHRTLNAVIMGRKTWDSIPPRSRPLKGRINVVVSRQPEKLGFAPDLEEKIISSEVKEQDAEPAPLAVSSIEMGLAALQARYPESEKGRTAGLGRVFVIGGAKIYALALGMEACERVLLTRVFTNFQCDTWLPVRLEEGEGGEGWVRRKGEELDNWAGEEVPKGRKVEAGVEWEYEMWERGEVGG